MKSMSFLKESELQLPIAEVLNKKVAFAKAYKPGSLYTVYQPIIKINGEEIIGYAGLTRGRGKWRNPQNLFRHSYGCGHTIALDYECLHTAVRILPKLGRNKLLFINVEPVTLSHTFGRGSEGELFLKKIAVFARQVVFELTEGMKSRDFEVVKRAVGLIRKYGGQFAIDDVAGIGSKLVKLISIKPDFIKIDMGLIKGISTNHLNQKIVHQLMLLARKYGSELIAEGVEDKTDLEFVLKMGIPYAQGFYFARPQKKLQRALPAIKS